MAGISPLNMSVTDRTTDPGSALQPIAKLRCIGCGAVRQSSSKDFRCLDCGDLFEVFYAGWKTANGEIVESLDVAATKTLWRDRLISRLPVDDSGVWRFREVLPALDGRYQAITIREGKTPLYELPNCARIAGV